MKNVDVLIVNYKTKELTLQAARSVLQEPETNQVIIVDNASGDDSSAFLEQELKGEPVKIIESKENIGFGRGNNLAATHATAPYLFLLNSDALVFPGCLSQLVAVLTTEPTVGLVAPAVYLPDRQTLQSDALGDFPTPWSIITQQTKNYSQSLQPDWISGVAMLTRREEFISLGGFSPELFLYFEDVELCFRYRQAGKQIRRTLAAGVVHLGGQSQKATKPKKDRYYRGQDQYLKVTKASVVGRLLVQLLRLPYRLLKGW